MNKTFLTGVDTSHEFLLKWWYKKITYHNPDIHITICDFGMSPEVRDWAKTHADHFISYPKHHKCAWFYKTQSMIDSPYEYTCWLDVDCEVQKPIDDIFNYAEQDKIGLTVDIIRGKWWATGVNLIKGMSPLLKDWHAIAEKAQVRGDQEALQEIIGKYPQRGNEIIKLPLIYQWLRLQLHRKQDNPNKRVVHWTGPIGKNHIRQNLMNKDDLDFKK